jgi:hypothetical protein
VSYYEEKQKRRIEAYASIRRSLEVTSTSSFLEVLKTLPEAGCEFPGNAYFAFFSSSHLAIKASRAASLFLKAVSAVSIPLPEQFSELGSGTPPQPINKILRPIMPTTLYLKFIEKIPF